MEASAEKPERKKKIGVTKNMIHASSKQFNGWKKRVTLDFTGKTQKRGVTEKYPGSSIGDFFSIL
jgi:hypothetical protein